MAAGPEPTIATVSGPVVRPLTTGASMTAANFEVGGIFPSRLG